jgi:SPP1 gp7 family putative phage head morphogenesis protein
MPDLFTENMKLSHRLQGIVNALGDEITETLEGASERITAKILLLEAKAEETKSLVRRKQYLEKQKAEIERVLNEVYQDISKTIKDKSIETAQASPEITDAILKKVIPDSFKIRMGIPKLSKKRVLLWFESSQIEGLFFNDYLKKLESNTASRVIRESRLALLSGETKKTAAKRIQEALNTGRHGAQALADTAIRSAQQWAETQYHLENRERLKGLRFIAELDRKTCPQCIPLDGRVFKVGDAPQPPIHMRCRCFLQPVFRNPGLNRYLAKQEKNVRIARIDTGARTVKHRDGTTSTKYEKLRVKFPPARTNYNQWMNSMVKSSDPRDVAFAKEALGPNRFKLVSSGKLKMNQLFYSGRLRNLKELKRLMK